MQRPECELCGRHAPSALEPIQHDKDCPRSILEGVHVFGEPPPAGVPVFVGVDIGATDIVNAEVRIAAKYGDLGDAVMNLIFTTGSADALELTMGQRRFYVIDNEAGHKVLDSIEKLNEEELEPFAKWIARNGRTAEIKREFGDSAQQVEPYKPNRSQRRAQDAAKRRKK